MATMRSGDRRRSLSNTAHERLKALLLSDSYLFTTEICGHRDLIPEIHAPISYLACGLTHLLIQTLDLPAFDSYVTRKLRHEFWRRWPDLGQYPWRTSEGRAAIDMLINGDLIRPAIINFRMSRRFFKSSTITHGSTLFIATNDPNETIKITHAIDPKAWEFVEQIGQTVMSGTYQDFFPDRIPSDPSTNVTQKKINLGGRTISHPQPTISGGGYLSKDEAAHFSTFVNDDLVVDGNSTPDLLVGVRKWLKGMTGFYMPKRRIRRLEVGTKHDEDDDDGMFTTGRMAAECLTIRVPIEEYKVAPKSILERGEPTCPQLFPKEKITAEQIHVLSGDEDEDGYRTWWNQYLLSSSGGSLRLFPPAIVDDPERWWMGPYEHPVKAAGSRGRYLVGRLFRTAEGRPVARPGLSLLDSRGERLEKWRDNAIIVTYDPWTELDRVCLVDPSWASEGDNWGVSAVGCDPHDVKYQLETVSDTNGQEGWIVALDELDRKWNFRVIGFDGAAMQDAVIQHQMRTDRRLRRLASRMVKVPHNQRSKPTRMQEGIAQPLLAYRFLLAPPWRGTGGEDAFGGNMTRSELKSIKSTPKHVVKNDRDGIADSLAMAGAVIRRSRSKQERELMKERALANAALQQGRVNDYLGVPMA